MHWYFTGATILIVIWAFGFIRNAIATFRTGKPFVVGSKGGHGAFPMSASFGRIGALFFTGIAVAAAFAFILATIKLWLDQSLS
jgi:hypothetical protein